MPDQDQPEPIVLEYATPEPRQSFWSMSNILTLLFLAIVAIALLAYVA